MRFGRTRRNTGRVYDKTHGSIFRYHESMLLDDRRVNAYREAIERSITPGDAVIDLGAGTGILSLIALRAGAGHVHLIEMGPVASLARQVISSAGFGTKVTFHKAHSSKITIPEPAQLLVTETIGNVAFDEGICGAIDDVRPFLSPNATIIPGRLELWAAAGYCSDIETVDQAWRDEFWGFDTTELAISAKSNLMFKSVERRELMSTHSEITAMDLTRRTEARAAATSPVRITRPGTINCVVAWFRAELVDGGLLDNEPEKHPGDSWSHGVLPLPQPEVVGANDAVDITIRFAGNGAVWQWDCRKATQDEASSTAMSTFAGDLLSVDDLRN